MANDDPASIVAQTAIYAEADTAKRIALRVNSDEFRAALGLLRSLVVVTGVGKSGHIGRRAAASWSSVGLASAYVDANEALHGDLGLVREARVIVALSNSGETKEVLAVVTVASAPVIGITARDSSLATWSDVILDASVAHEVDPTGVVPTASLAAQNAWVDALMIGWMQRHSVTADMFKINHPGGAIGGNND